MVEANENVNQCYEPPAYERLDALNDKLDCVVRLLGKPEACMTAPEVMDIVSMASMWLRDRYQELAFEMRKKHRAAKGDSDAAQ